MIATCWFTTFIIQYICLPYYSNYLAMLYQWSHIWTFISTHMHDVEIHECMWGELHLYCSFVTLFGWPLQLFHTTFLFPIGFSLSFSLVIFLTFYLPLALPIFFNFSLPFALATTKVFSLALPTFLGATFELRTDLLFLLSNPIHFSTTSFSWSSSPSSFPHPPQN